jgi:antitoxin HigA-1
LSRKEPIVVGMSPPHPGEFVREEVLAPLRLSVSRAAEVLGVRRATLSDFVNRKASLSPEMALRLEKAFDLSMDQLLAMQAWHDAAEMRKKVKRVTVRRYVPPAIGTRG